MLLFRVCKSVARMLWMVLVSVLTNCVFTEARYLLGRKLLGNNSGDSGSAAETALFVFVVSSSGVYMSFKWCCCRQAGAGSGVPERTVGVSEEPAFSTVPQPVSKSRGDTQQPLLSADSAVGHSLGNSIGHLLGLTNGVQMQDLSADQSTPLLDSASPSYHNLPGGSTAGSSSATSGGSLPASGTSEGTSNPSGSSSTQWNGVIRSSSAAGHPTLAQPSFATSGTGSGLSSKYRSPPDWTIPADQLHLTGRLGGGSFGDVFLGDWNGTTVAVKCLQPGVAFKHSATEGNALQALKALKKEVAILSHLRHPNIVLFLGVSLEPLRMVTEFCERGSLRDVLSAAHSSGEAIPWSTRLAMVLDAARGMRYLHSRQPPILHCDLKSPNLLVDQYWRVKVGDFGLSHMLNPLSGELSTHNGDNPRWMAPEVMQGAEFSEAADVFAFGIILWELLTYELPYSDMNAWQISFQVTMQNVRPDIPDPQAIPGGTFSGLSKLISLMQQCWDGDAGTRPTFETIISELQQIQATVTPNSSRQSSASAASATAPASTDVPSVPASAPVVHRSLSDDSTREATCAGLWQVPVGSRQDAGGVKGGHEPQDAGLGVNAAEQTGRPNVRIALGDLASREFARGRTVSQQPFNPSPFARGNLGRNLFPGTEPNEHMSID